MKLGGTGWSNRMPCPPALWKKSPDQTTLLITVTRHRACLCLPGRLQPLELLKRASQHLLQEPGVTLNLSPTEAAPHKLCLFILFPSEMLWRLRSLLSNLRCHVSDRPRIPREEHFSHCWGEEEAIMALLTSGNTAIL